MLNRFLITCTSVLMLLAFKPVLAQKSRQNSSSDVKSQIRFLEDIEVGVPNASDGSAVKLDESKTFTELQLSPKTQFKNVFREGNGSEIENASVLQLKYAVLLNTEVEQVQNISLYKLIDEWFGTRYVLGGTSKKGIDCSAFVQVLYTGLFGISLPRTAREQYKVSRQISRVELKEGDFVFFNTRGGVSHVGIYLQNNKFVHAASSGGVMISDLFDDYWVTKFIGAGRYEKPEPSQILKL
ncbi:MAG: C40 family peptidase [Chitinophagaceae bacterium]|nr:C40 family peptidase [Chitinophagaceae bacterium]